MQGDFADPGRLGKFAGASSGWRLGSLATNGYFCWLRPTGQKISGKILIFLII